MDLGQLHDWLFEHSELPLESETDQLFVVKCKFYWPEEKYTELYADSKPEYLRTHDDLFNFSEISNAPSHSSI